MSSTTGTGAARRNNTVTGDRQTHGASVVRGPALTWLSRLIIVAGIAWVAFVFSRDFAALRTDFQIASWPWLAATVGLGMLALLLTVPVLQTLVRVYGSVPLRYTYAARLTFVAHVLRHLPGRLWGIMYLVAETRSAIPTGAMVRANLDLMLYSLVFNLLIAAILFLATTGSELAAIACALAGLTAVACAVRYDWLGRLLQALVRFAPVRGARFADALSARGSVSWPVALSIPGWFALVWVCYLTIWWALARIFPVLGDVNIWLLCASYSVAWVAGYLAMITPAGLGVREAGFFVLASSLATLPSLTFLAVFIRLWQLLIEMLLFAAFAFVKPATTTDNASGDEPTDNAAAAKSS